MILDNSEYILSFLGEYAFCAYEIMYVFTIIAIILIAYTINKMNNKNYKYAFLILIFLLVFTYMFKNTTKTMIVEYCMFAFIAIFSIYFLGLLKRLDICDYGILFLGLIYSTSNGYGIAVIEEETLIMFFIVLGTLVKFKYKTLRGNTIFIWISTVLAILHIALFRKIDYAIFKNYIGMIQSTVILEDIIKLVLYIIATISLLVMAILLMIIEKKLLSNWVKDVESFGIRYKELDVNFIISAIILCLCTSLIPSAYVLLQRLAIDLTINERASNTEIVYSIVFNNVDTMLTGIVLLVIGVQFFYLNMLIKTARLRAKIEVQSEKNDNLILYNNSLSENMNNMRQIRHDIKNIFLTMGEFVEKSDNEDMKAFYKEKIFPYADYEIKMSDFLCKLDAVKDEQFKSFLYYKIMLGISNDVEMNLSINLKNGWENGIEYSDIIRMLGIFIDNAIEENVNLPEGEIDIQIDGDEDIIKYLIRNKVSEETKIKGIKSGVSDKGLKRGNGLLIVDNIVSKYKNVIHNGYFKEDYYIQSLTIILTDK